MEEMEEIEEIDGTDGAAETEEIGAAETDGTEETDEIGAAETDGTEETDGADNTHFGGLSVPCPVFAPGTPPSICTGEGRELLTPKTPLAGVTTL
jgi:hypothetical protein